MNMDENPLVTLSATCSARGKVVFTTEDVPSCAYLGIPYAKPPVGKLRFQPPQHADLWQGERDCRKYGNFCLPVTDGLERLTTKFHFGDPKSEPSEDCLYLNIWTPYKKTSGLFPVMFWLHGGCFSYGASNFYNGSAVAAYHDVITVSINYRIGAFGFMTSGDDVIPGNFGLLDQVAALKWVRQNIMAFGGNPDEITIYGESAGGMSTSLHVISPMTKGLFRRAICQSGTATSPYAVRTKQQAMEAIKPGLLSIGFNGKSSNDMLEFLQKLPAQDIADAFNNEFKAVIDGTYLTDFPDKLYKEGKFNQVDMMVGYTSDDGQFFVKSYPLTPDEPGPISPNKATIRYHVKDVARYTYPFSNDVNKITDKLVDLYITPEILKDNARLQKVMVDIYGDAHFIAPSIQVAENHSSKASVFLYRFDYRPSFSVHPPWIVSDHLDEVYFHLAMPLIKETILQDVTFSEEDKCISKMMMAYWTNFAKNGNPNGEGLQAWPEYKTGDCAYTNLKIQPDTGKNYKPKHMDFWMKQIHQLDTGRYYK